MSRLQDRINQAVNKQPKYQEQPIEEPKEQYVADNPHTLYQDMQTNPVPQGILPETVGRGHTLDFSALEKYQIYVQTPRKMRNYMRYQKAMTIEDIKGFSKGPKIKFSWTLILIVAGAIGALVLGFMIMSNPDAITNFLSGIMPNM